MSQENEPRWQQAVREQLDADAAGYDAATLSRLNRARQAALDAGLRPQRRPWWHWSLVAVATSAAVVLAVALTLRTPEISAPPVAPVALEQSEVDDLELLAAGEDLELIENLEFYAWLEQQSLDG